MDALLAEKYKNTTGVTVTDRLTDLYNNGFFQISLEFELKRFERYGNKFSIVLIDVDSFSHFNMSHGPLEGDLLLKEIAGIIKKNIREVDIAARYSGNTFAVIVTQSDSQQALNVAERIRQDVEKEAKGASTVSIGIACCPDDATSGRPLISKAKEALAGVDLSKIACRECSDCRVDCAMGFDVKGRIEDVARIGNVPDEFVS